MIKVQQKLHLTALFLVAYNTTVFDKKHLLYAVICVLMFVGTQARFAAADLQDIFVM